MKTLLTLLTLLLVPAAVASAQKEKSPAKAIEAYFAEPDDRTAARALEKIFGDFDAAAIEKVVTARPQSPGGVNTFRRSLGGTSFMVTTIAPDDHDADDPPLPVIFCSASSRGHWGLIPDMRVIKVAAWDLKPGVMQFSDEGRDIYTHALNLAAWASNGDLENMWMTGFSWAGHASSDQACHRPGLLRGVIPMGGGPRRKWFRLGDNLRGMKVLFYCGGRDDKELIWNLQEFARVRKKHGYECTVVIDPQRGHQNPNRGLERIPKAINSIQPRDTWPKKGTLLADGPRVENLWLRIDEVDPRAVFVPRRIPVVSSLSHDGKRRATIGAMRKKVAKLEWQVRIDEQKSNAVTIKLKSKGVKRATVLIRRSMLEPGQKLTITGGKGSVRVKALAVSPQVMLEEARRLGLRSDPVIARYTVKFRG